jgi:hypothetical protein
MQEASESSPPIVAVDRLMVFSSSLKGLEGSAKPAKEGDNLDVTAPQLAVDAGDKEAPHFAKPLLSSTSSSVGGLGFGSKLFFVLLIIGACVVFVRTRSNQRSSNVGWKDRVMA